MRRCFCEKKEPCSATVARGTTARLPPILAPQEKLLKDYAIKDPPIKDHGGLAEITVIVKPKLPYGRPVSWPGQPTAEMGCR